MFGMIIPCNKFKVICQCQISRSQFSNKWPLRGHSYFTNTSCSISFKTLMNKPPQWIKISFQVSQQRNQLNVDPKPPLLIKLAPDLSDQDKEDVTEVVMKVSVSFCFSLHGWYLVLHLYQLELFIK